MSGQRSTRSRKVQEPKRPPYALVIYDVDKSKGVVSSEELSAKAAKGSVCLAPDPVDWAGVRANKKHKAMIIEFGYDIEFLYQIPIDKQGTVSTAEICEEQKAVKRQRLKEQGAQKKRKVDEETQLNFSTDSLEALDSITNNLGSEATASQAISDKSVDKDSGVGEPIKEISEGLDLNASTNPPNLEITSPQRCLTSTVPTMETLKCPASCSDCPLKDVLQKASPSNLNFFIKVCEAVQQHQQPKQSDKEPAKERSKISNENLLWEDLECFKLEKPGTTIKKFPLVENIPVYITKPEKFSIPPLMAVPEGRNAKQKKPPGKENVLYPRQMVNYLLDLLVPREMLQKVHGLDLHKSIFKAIKSYINYRLPENDRISSGILTSMVSDHCRNIRRDREAEAQRRKERLSAASTSRVSPAEAQSLLNSFDQIPIVVQTDENNLSEICIISDDILPF